MATGPEIAFLVGRLLLGGYFIMSGVNHFAKRQILEQYASHKGTPAPKLAVLGTGAILILGGLSVLLGVYPLVGIAFLAVFLLGVTPMMHDFWKLEDPQQRTGEMVNFTKNIALLGAIVALAVVPRPWPLSLGIGF